jgi:cytidylate kinase
MKTDVLAKGGGLSRAAERQMRTWALDLETRQRLEQEAPAPKPLIYPYIAISRETGVDAGEIGALVAQQFGWKVFDRELLDYMAEHYNWSRVALDYVDERTASWFHETFAKWLDQHVVSQAEYVSRLGKIILLAAQHERYVFVGRGVQFILPREFGLNVRIIAPRNYRINRVMELQQCSRRSAEKFIDDHDKGRADFVQRYFRRDVADPHLYDVIVNLEHMSRQAAVDLIVDDYRIRFERPVSAK